MWVGLTMEEDSGQGCVGEQSLATKVECHQTRVRPSGPQNREWTKANDTLKQVISWGIKARANGLFNTCPLTQPSFPIGCNTIVASRKQQNLG